MAATTSIVWTAAADGAVVDDMSSWEAFTGQTRDEYKGWGWLNAVHPDDRENTVTMWRHALETKKGGETEDRVRHRDGHYRHMLVRGVPVFGADGNLCEWVGTCTDITERKQAEADLVRMANYDALTGLPNRMLFTDRLDQALSRAVRYEEKVAVLFVDLDGFKHVNDTLGHDAGDLLLKAMAQRLTACVRGSDTVARFGGDEFVVMLVDFARSLDVNRIAEQILTTLSKRMRLNGHELSITASIGISVYSRDGDDAHALLKSADTAMYLAKQGRNRYRYFSTSLGAKTSRRMVLEQDLRRALEREEFVLHYQPQIELASGRIDAAEALLRWRRPGRNKLVSPLEFIPLAEERGLIVQIGEWGLRAACAQSRAWRLDGLPPVRLAVNVSSRQFRQRNMQKVIDGVLRETGVDHACLELELTESILQSEEAERTIVALEKSGISIAIDDFGTGYCSLSYLKRFPVSKLKIDRSFTHGIPAHQDNVAISTAIIALGHTLKLKVTAEGVETAQQLACLRTLGCDGAQGYLLGRPLPAEDLAKLLAASRRHVLMQLDSPLRKGEGCSP